MYGHVVQTKAGAVRLTTTELKILSALRAYHAEHGRMPTGAHLLHMVGWRTRGPLTGYLRRLEDKGAIKINRLALPVEIL